MKNQLDINLTLFQLTEKFRSLVSFVFESLGKDDENTTFETFNDIGRFKVDSTNIGFFSFRNDEFFYWIFMKVMHRDNSVGSETLHQEFEVQIKKSDVPIFQIFGEHVESGQEVSARDWHDLKEIPHLNFEFAEDYATFAENFVQKITGKLEAPQ